MKKLTLLSLVIAIATNVFAQTMYVADKQGLIVREKPFVDAKVLGNIPYGKKAILIEQAEEDIVNESPIVTEGFTGKWRKLKFNNKTGYIIDSYVFPVPPPQKNTISLKDYFNQLSTVAGTSRVKKPGTTKLIGNSGEELIKKLYKNGMEIHEFNAHEYGSETYILPEFSIQNAFLLARLLPEYATFVTSKAAFPLQNSTGKTEDGGEKIITIEKDADDHIRTLQIELTGHAPYEFFKIYLLEGQAVITSGSSI